jgi:MipA family protein
VTIARPRLLLAVLALAATSAAARDEPLWEAGIGVAGLHFPDYRGSDHTRNYVLPAPYLVYRGDFFKADRYGLRGVLLKSDRVDLNLSVGASLPVDSKDDRARAGMPDLKPSLELGPSLQVTVWRSDDHRLGLVARFPLRGAMTVESSPRFIGTQFFPHLNVDVYDPGGFDGWHFGALAGPVYTDARYNHYFYEVPAAFATASRPAYTPGGGYAGMQFLSALSRRYPKFWVGAFARYDTLRGAAFETSPLVTSKRYVSAGFAVSWVLGVSDKRVPVADFGDEPR